MGTEAYKIRDLCRKNLVKYTLKAFTLIPGLDDALVLDAGCRTGESVLALLEVSQCRVVAVDSDRECVSVLNEKVKATDFKNRIKVIHGSIVNKNIFHDPFDIVLAEGLLNIIGFEHGLVLILECMKQGGYLILHDQWENDAEKRELLKKYHLKLVRTFELDEVIWGDDYYGCLEQWIRTLKGGSHMNEIKVIDEYKKNPDKCKSMVYVLTR